MVSQLGHFREHVKPIRGEEDPSTRLFSAYVGVEREDRKLRRREGNSMSMISGLGAGTWFSHQDGTGFGSRPLRGSNGLLTSGHCQVAHVLERPGPQGAAPREWLHPAPCQTLPPASKLQKGGSFVRPRFQGAPAPSPHPPGWGPEATGPAPSSALNKSIPQRSSLESDFLPGKNAGIRGEGREVTLVGFVFFTSCYKYKLVITPKMPL